LRWGVVWVFVFEFEIEFWRGMGKASMMTPCYQLSTVMMEELNNQFHLLAKLL
jgi:hypothetical protein